MSVHDAATPERFLRHGEDPLLPVGHAPEVHHLAKAPYARQIQQLRRLRGPHAVSGVLKPRSGGDRGRRHHQDPQGKSPGRIHQRLHAPQSQHISDLMGVRRHRGGPAAKGRPGKMSRRQHAAFQVHVGIHKARQSVTAAAVQYLCRLIGRLQRANIRDTVSFEANAPL